MVLARVHCKRKSVARDISVDTTVDTSPFDGCKRGSDDLVGGDADLIFEWG